MGHRVIGASGDLEALVFDFDGPMTDPSIVTT